MQPEDLLDLSHWRFVEVWTIDEAALLWAGIDPVCNRGLRIENIEQLVSFDQFRKALIFQRAISEAICAGTLPFETAWELHEHINGEWEQRVEFPNLPEPDKIMPWKSRVKQAAFLQWAKSKGIPSHRQSVITAARRPNRQASHWQDSAIEADAKIVSEAAPAPALPAPSYLDADNPRYAAKLAAAIKAWQQVTDPGSRSPRKALESYLLENYRELGLTNQDGSPNKTGIEEAAKVANWKPQGGSPKTPG